MSAQDSVSSEEKRPQAEWHIDLMVDCPGCKEHVNLTSADDFWLDRIIQPCEPRKEFEVICPDCGHEFEVDCVY